MRKNNKETIKKYINGETIEEYNIEDLENDAQFMMSVIKETNDKNFYKLCSEKVKQNYGFVKFMIKKFKKNIEFIDIVAQHYIDHTEEEIQELELLIIMNEITKENKEINGKYNLFLDTKYEYKKLQIELTKNEIEDEYAKQRLGMGFFLIFDNYTDSKIILNFFAKKMVSDITDEYDIDLEKVLNKRFNSLKEIEIIGINTYLLNFISKYDSMLSSYLSTNIELLSEMKEKVKSIINKSQKNRIYEDSKRYSILFERINDYMSEFGKDSIFDETALIYYVAHELCLTKSIKKYDIYGQTNPEKEIDYEFISDTIKMNIKEQIHYRNVRKIMEDVIFSETIPEDKDTTCKKIIFKKKDK